MTMERLTLLLNDWFTIFADPNRQKKALYFNISCVGGEQEYPLLLPARFGEKPFVMTPSVASLMQARFTSICTRICTRFVLFYCAVSYGCMRQIVHSRNVIGNGRRVSQIEKPRTRGKAGLVSGDTYPRLSQHFAS